MQSKPYHYYIGPWVWVDEGKKGMSFWRSPEGTVGCVDLRTLDQCGKAGGTPEGFGFFAVDGILPAPYKEVSSGYLSTTPLTNKTEIGTATGYSAKGSTGLDFIWEMLTDAADPKGITSVKPLMPDVKGNLDLYLGGHSLVKTEKFVYGAHSHTQKVKETIQNSYRELRAEDKKKSSENYRKVLDMLGEKYGISKPEDEFIPDDLPKETPIKHNTTVTEDFNGADKTASIGYDLSWSQLDFGVFYNTTNRAMNHSSFTQCVYRADSDFSSSDNYAQVDVILGATNIDACGPIARLSSSASTGYLAWEYTNDNKLYFQKIVTNTRTDLSAAVSVTIGSDTVKVSCSGSTIKSYQNGTEKHSVTDTSIETGVRGGFWGYQGTADVSGCDNFEAGDLGEEPPTVVPLRMLMGIGV